MLLRDPVTTGSIIPVKNFSGGLSHRDSALLVHVPRSALCAPPVSGEEVATETFLPPPERAPPIINEVIHTDIEQARKGTPGTYRANVLYDGVWGEALFTVYGEKDHEKVRLLEYCREGLLSWKPTKLSLRLSVLLREKVGSFRLIHNEELRTQVEFMAGLVRSAFDESRKINDVPYEEWERSR
jgi:hypothetical protein